MESKKRGFTLIELILVLALIGMVTTVAYSIFFTGQKGFEVGIDKGSQQADYRILREYLTKELRNTSYLSNSVLDEKIFTKNVYYTLKSEKENGNFVLSKTKFKDNKPEPSFTIPINMDKVEIISEGNIIKVKFVPGKIKESSRTNKEYDFTILLENNPKFRDITLNESENIIYYTYPEDTKVISESSDGNNQENITIPPNNLDGIKDWDETTLTKYYIGDKVIHDERVFISIHPDINVWEPGKPNHYWNEVTDVWKEFNIYKKGDKVLYKDKQTETEKWYICKINGSTYHTPIQAPNNWELTTPPN